MRPVSRFVTCVGLLLLLAACAAPIVERQIPLDPASSTSRANYLLGPGDIVQITVFQEDDMASEQRLAQDGTINFPLVGRIKIGGRNVEQAGDAIADRLRDGILINPQVTVAILEYAPRRFSIFGEVKASGSFEIPSEEVVTLPTAVAMAGGKTQIGNLRRVIVTRSTDTGISEFRVNLLSPAGRQFVVQDRDLIMVPESLF
jgi:polysaccharide export outer membrane protein